MTSSPPKLLILGAHPDDAEYHAGGLATIYRRLGRQVKIVSVSDGRAGHFVRSADELVSLRRQEAAAAGRIIGATYETWDLPDAELVPDLSLRRRLVREIRTFAPDMILTHRTSDYHPDHRAVGQAVQDASYLVTVPRYLSEVPALHRCPVIASMIDLFQRPCPFMPHVVLDVAKYVDSIIAMLACHRSQVFEWLPYEEGLLEQVPAGEDEKMLWLRGWYERHTRPRADRFRSRLIEVFGNEAGNAIELMEAYEVSEYGSQLNDELRSVLFPDVTLSS